MTRINHTLVFVTLAAMLASTGCGDAGSFEETPLEDSGRVADDTVSTDDTTLTLEDELQFACEAYCEAANSCRRALFAENCTEHCADERRPDADDACIVAEINLMNCYSPTSCDTSPEELRIECSDAMLEFRVACTSSELRRELEDDGDTEVIRLIERAPAEDGEPEETGPSEGAGDEDPEESEDSGPVFELPEVPDFPYFPEPGVVIELP
ncbi:MAG: hypothetical protein WBN30_13175 [Polyangiales bacterium]